MAHQKNIIEAGKPLKEAKKALIMLHGRGASAQDILSLKEYLPVDDFYIAAPQATNFTWYPYSFMAPVPQNEPWLSSALKLLNSLVNDIEAGGIKSENIFVLGFSQGACLTLEFATRNARRWGGVASLTGGLIGEKIHHENYLGNFNGTPVYISNSNNDPHVPLSRSEESKKIMESMGAVVSLQIFTNRPHTILKEELDGVGRMMANK
jgi:phospholipase/carboxylesterase